MYDYMYDTQMFDEPSEYQDETRKFYRFPATRGELTESCWIMDS